MQLGDTGVWFFTDMMAAPRAAEFAQRLEAQGYGALWLPEAVGRHPFAHAAFLLARTERLIVATGIANIYARDPSATAAAQKTLAEQSDGRFLLGLGVSHQPFVENVRGHTYGKPVATMRGYLERMDKAIFAGVGPSEAPPTVLAALGPKMLALAAEKTRGAHPYFTTPEHTAMARDIMGPDAWLCVEQKVLLVTDPTRARELARATAGMYIGLPNYRNNWKRLGFQESDFDNGGSDKLIDALVAWGDEKTLVERVRQHHEAGASHVCIQPIHPQGLPLPDENVLALLAPGRG